jgi:WD40 repeat protein
MIPPPRDATGRSAGFDPLRIRLAKELKHDSPLISCRFDCSGRFVFAGAQDSMILRWEVGTGKKAVLAGHRSWVRGLASARRGTLLFTSDYAGRLICWPAHANTPKPVWTIAAHSGWVRAVAISPDESLVATCGNDQLVKLWSLDGKPVRDLPGHGSHVYNVAFHPQGRTLVSADLMGVVKEWDLASGRQIRDLDAGVLHKYDKTFEAHIGGVRGIAFSADGRLLACAGITAVQNAFAGVGKPLVLLFDMATGQQKQLLVPRENFQGTAWGVVVHPVGLIAGVGGGNGGALWVWKPDQPQAIHTVKLPNNARDLSMNAAGTGLAVAFFDGAVRLYDWGSKKPG